MKATELTVLDQEELTDRLKSSRRELYELRFKLAVGQLEDHRQIRKVRKDIARILTVLHQREGAATSEAAAQVATQPSPPSGEDVETEQ
jgi:large subunit ribosomal protein L29